MWFMIPRGTRASTGAYRAERCFEILLDRDVTGTQVRMYSGDRDHTVGCILFTAAHLSSTRAAGCIGHLLQQVGDPLWLLPIRLTRVAVTCGCSPDDHGHRKRKFRHGCAGQSSRTRKRMRGWSNGTALNGLRSSRASSSRLTHPGTSLGIPKA
jgi:hypothetical protein